MRGIRDGIKSAKALGFEISLIRNLESSIYFNQIFCNSVECEENMMLANPPKF
jgi:hypothetical protein